MIEKTIKIEGHLDYFIEQIAIRFRRLGYVQLINDETNLAKEAWANICYEKLSEEFIVEFQDKIYWNTISLKQNLSKDFICKFSDKLNFRLLPYNDNISDEIKEFCRMFV